MSVVLHERKDGVAILTINRPDKLNALNSEVLESLWNELLVLQSDREIGAVVVTGAGQKAFVAGADIAQLNEQDRVSGKVFAERGQRVFNLLEQLGKPVIAAVNGFALGGGCELALACHIRFASHNSVFGQPEINLGIIPGYGGTQRLPRVVGQARAMEIILSGDKVSAEQALQFGLVSRLYSQEDLLPNALAFASQLAAKAPIALRACLEAIQRSTTMSLLDGLNAEASLFGVVCGTTDFKEGTSAFLEKRSPLFTGN